MKICSKNNINSIKCYEYFINKKYFVIVMELCDNNLSKLLMDKFEKDNKGFNEKEIKEIFKQLNKTFKIMKENKIIHRDLKLENILIKYNDKQHKTFTIKLSDYGCSKRLNSLTKNYCQTNIGTIIYMAPEILKRLEYNYKCDLWSIGIIIYKLIFCKSPFSGETETSLINNIENLGNKYLKKIGNKNLDDLIEKLLEKDKKIRLNWDEYLNHPFFKDKYKKKIKFIYEHISWYDNNIFGEKFVENNKDKIELIINDRAMKLVKEYELEEGENEIEIIIKDKITNLEYIFYNCTSLKNIDQLKYLDTDEINNFSYMFYECKSLSDIRSIENWNVSNGKKFSGMFKGCEILSDIKALYKWNISNGNDFSEMFHGCKSLSDINVLENWNVLNGKNFSSIFCFCNSLLDIKALKNWNV